MRPLRLALAGVRAAGFLAVAEAQPPAGGDPKATQPPAAGTPAPAPPAAGDKHKFEVKFEKDKAFFQKMKTAVSQTIKVQGGTDLNQNHAQTFYFKWTPVKQDGDKWVVNQTIEGVQMEIDIAGNKVKYDTTNPNEPGAGGNPGLVDFFKNLVGTEFKVTMGKAGAVEKVEGKDDFLKKLNGVNAQMESLLRKILTDEALKQMTDPNFGMTPAEPKGVGESWEKKSVLNLGPVGSYDVTSKYTYKGKDPTKKDLDRVEVAMTLAYKPPTDAQEGLLFRIKSGELKTEEPKPGDAPNFILFDPKAGRITESSLGVKLKGTLSINVGNADTTVELNQDQRTTVESGDKSLMPEAKK